MKGLLTSGCLLLALLLTMMTTPLYRATAVLQMEKQSQQIVQGGELTGPGYGWDPEEDADHQSAGQSEGCP